MQVIFAVIYALTGAYLTGAVPIDLDKRQLSFSSNDLKNGQCKPVSCRAC